MASTPISGRWAFLKNDIDAQLDVSKSVLDEARRIEELINDQSTSQELRKQLIRVRDGLLDQAKRLTANAVTTSNTAVQVLVSTST